MVGWPGRARALLADLLAFDADRLAWALALRTNLGLAIPLLLAHALHEPSLVWVGFGAYLLAIGDSTDDGDRAQPLRIAAGAILGGIALATGVLAGATLATAILGMLAWGLLTGMMGVYGNAFATMSLPIAWAYVELGLPSNDHGIANAAQTGLLFALGGLLTLALTVTLRLGGTVAPVRAQTAVCFREVARYLDAPRGAALDPPESRVRAAIAEGRRRATQARQQAAGASRANQRALMLIETADRIYSVIAAMREAGEPPPPATKPILFAIATSLTGPMTGRAKPASLRGLRAELPAHDANRTNHATALAERLTQELSRALGIAARGATPFLQAIPAASSARLDVLVAPVLANLDRNSVNARHALRFAVVAAVAVAVYWYFPKPFGYWVPLTATVVLKPYAGMTLSRAVQRATGTTLGILLGLALMPFLPSLAAQFTFVMIFFIAMMAVLPFNYGLAILFLSAGLIPFEHLLTPSIAGAVGTQRLAATAIGVALALIGGHLLWPTFQRRDLHDILRAAARATASYADTVLAAHQGSPDADMQAARRHAGLLLSNLQVAVQRSLTELGGNPETVTASLRAAAALQRLSITLNLMLQTATAGAALPLVPFRAAFVPALADPTQPEPPLRALRDLIPPTATALLSRELDGLVSGLEMLRATMAG